MIIECMLPIGALTNEQIVYLSDGAGYIGNSDTQIIFQFDMWLIPRFQRRLFELDPLPLVVYRILDKADLPPYTRSSVYDRIQYLLTRTPELMHRYPVSR